MEFTYLLVLLTGVTFLLDQLIFPTSILQITTLYNCGEQKSFSECTRNLSLKLMGYNKPCWVPFLSAKNRKLSLHWAQTHQNWAAKDWKNAAWSDGFQFLLSQTDSKVKIRRQHHASMEPVCLVSTVQADGDAVMVWRIFFGTLWPSCNN